MEVSLIKDRDIIVFGLQPWDIPIGSNCKNMAAVMARHNRVLYVNRPLDRKSAYGKADDVQTRQRIAAVREGKDILTKADDQLWVFNPRVVLESINFLPVSGLYNFLNKRNNRLLAKEIQYAANTLNFKNYILFVDNDFFNALYLKEYLQPDYFVYYIRDNLRSQKYFSKHGAKAEPAIMAKADLVAANSKYLAEYASRYNDAVVDVGQGCDVEDFVNPPVRVEDMHVDSPVIGYCGSITATRLDVALLLQLAERNPQWNFVFVGPEDEVFKSSGLHQISNVYFLGSKKPETLPAYIHGFDVCINPQLLNDMTIGNYPRKVDEYLAAGKPVVATYTQAMEMFADYCYLCTDVQSYEMGIQQALSETNLERKQERQDFAKAHTWEASVESLYKKIKLVTHEV